MKRVRFALGGTVMSGTWDEAAGLLRDERGKSYAEPTIRFLPPCEPKNVVGLALNYADHADELGLERPSEPTLFLKPVTSLIGHKQAVVFPSGSEFMHYEVELAVVIGKPCRKAHEQDALDYVEGYTIANDITVRDYIRNMYRPPVRAKGFDTFGPIGPALVPKAEIADPGKLELRAYVNGELRQVGNTANLVHSVPQLIAFISAFMTLHPGDIILTGTPKGISKIYPGDMVRLEIDGLGALENRIVEESAGAP